MAKTAKTKSFEERLERLEAIGQSMRDGELELEEAVKLFDEGMRLAKGLEKDLSRIERKVQILVNEPGAEDADEPTLELFQDSQEQPEE
jgi:exodeoxyribonuclease VII small subunit